MKIDWTKFEQVALAAIGFSAVVVVVYSFGIRFLTNAQHLAGKSGKGKQAASGRELGFRILSYVFFAIAAVAVAWAVIWMFQVMYTPAKK